MANKTNISSGKKIGIVSWTLYKCAFFGIFEIEGTTCGVPLKDHKTIK